MCTFSLGVRIICSKVVKMYHYHSIVLNPFIFVTAEVSCDYNAGFQSALAALYFDTSFGASSTSTRNASTTASLATSGRAHASAQTAPRQVSAYATLTKMPHGKRQFWESYRRN